MELECEYKTHVYKYLTSVELIQIRLQSNVTFGIM